MEACALAAANVDYPECSFGKGYELMEIKDGLTPEAAREKIFVRGRSVR